MALTKSPLSMAAGTAAFARMDTRRQVAILRSQGQNVATEALLSRLRAHDVDVWSVLVTAMRRERMWPTYVDASLAIIAGEQVA